jgi:hypothetical protein
MLSEGNRIIFPVYLLVSREGIPPFFRERRSGCGFLHDEFDSEYIY